MSVVRDPGGSLYAIYGTRVERATAALPASTAAAIFTIATGRILLTSIVGEVTTVIQTQACDTQLTFDPTDAGATQALCADLDITADAVGTMYSITGTPATAMQDALNFLPSSKVLAQPILLKPGQILLDTSATNTGSVKWSLTYIAYDTGASVTAA